MDSKVKVLCVDDDSTVLLPLCAHLRRRFEVFSALSGEKGLEIIEKERDVAVVVSDMHMPGMNGAAFLSAVRRVSPDTVRILLTGQSDLESAVDAVNQGQIFRFLRKPCPIGSLLSSVDAGVQQNRLLTSERVLLEQTLRGSIEALTDALSLTSPLSFGRATRVKLLVSDLAAALHMEERWQVEVAAMLSQLACITLPTETAERVYYGRTLSPGEQAMVDRLPEVTEQLLGRIPRLETVREILAAHTKPIRQAREGDDAQTTLVNQGAQLLRVALDFDTLETQGSDPINAIASLRHRTGVYDPSMLDALVRIRGVGTDEGEVREVSLTGLRAGMVLVTDMVLNNGVLLVARRYQITVSLLERLQNLPKGSVKEPFHVMIPPTPRQSDAIPALI